MWDHYLKAESYFLTTKISPEKDLTITTDCEMYYHSRDNNIDAIPDVKSIMCEKRIGRSTIFLDGGTSRRDSTKRETNRGLRERNHE